MHLHATRGRAFVDTRMYYVRFVVAFEGEILLCLYVYFDHLYYVYILNIRTIPMLFVHFHFLCIFENARLDNNGFLYFSLIISMKSFSYPGLIAHRWLHICLPYEIENAIAWL